MKTFSERKGLKPIADVIQVDSMNEALRNSLWNVLDVVLWSTNGFVSSKHGQAAIEPFSRALWFDYFKQPMDSRPDRGFLILKEIRTYFFSCQWNEAYDFLQWVVFTCERTHPKLAEFINHILERELSGYRFVAGHLADVTTPEELMSVEDASKGSAFSGVSAHIRRAVELYANRENPGLPKLDKGVHLCG
jgi:hypothetical protein